MGLILNYSKNLKKILIFYEYSKLSIEHYKNIDKLILHTILPVYPTFEHKLFLNFTFIVFRTILNYYK